MMATSLSSALSLVASALLLAHVNAGPLLTTTYPGPVVRSSTASTANANSPCNIVSEVNLPVTVTTSCGTVTAYLLDRADSCEQVRTTVPGSPLAVQCYTSHYPWAGTLKIRLCTPNYTILTQTINVGSCTASVDYMRVSSCTCAYPSQLYLGTASEANVLAG